MKRRIPWAKIWSGGVAYLALAIGCGLSIAGNVADTFRVRGPATDQLDIVLAAAWPILVLLTIEMFVSRRWSLATGYQTLRWFGCLAIGGMTMTASWTHLHDLMASRGQLPAVAILGPFALDGMAIMATGLILSSRGRRPGLQWPRTEAFIASSNGGQAASAVAEIGQDVGELRAWVQDLAIRVGHPKAPSWPVAGPPDPSVGEWPEDLAKSAAAAMLGQVDPHPVDMRVDSRRPDPGEPVVPISPVSGGPASSDEQAWLESLDLVDTSELEAGDAATFVPVAGPDGTVANRADQVTIPDGVAEALAKLTSDGLAKAEIDSEVADRFHVSVRTARRWRGLLANRVQGGGQE